MIRQIALLELRADATAAAIEAFERALQQAQPSLPGVRRGHLGRHHEGSVGGGD